jgi:hypothetical protein
MKERILAWYNKSKDNKDLMNQSWKKKPPAHVLFHPEELVKSQCGMVLHKEKDEIIAGCQQAFADLKKELASTKSSELEPPDNPENARYIQKCFEDLHVWMGQPDEKRKNPLNSSLDKGMFYW